ncbi:MAG: PAS domain S-box protein, partial [Myxococcales bacterium]
MRAGRCAGVKSAWGLPRRARIPGRRARRTWTSFAPGPRSPGARPPHRLDRAGPGTCVTPIRTMPTAMNVEAFFEMLRYVRWGDDDERALQALLPHVEPHLPSIVDEFYDRIREHPQAAAVFRDEAQVRRLQQTLQRWVRELLGGPHDQTYYEQRCLIGAVHARIGLPQRYVCSAMSLIRSHLQRIAVDAFGPGSVAERRTREALEKILDLELAIMLETYRGAMLERIRRVEAGEREGMALKLAAAEERHRSTVESSPALVLVLDGAGVPIVWNRAASRLTGYERDELAAGSALDLLLPDPEARARIRRVTPEAPDTFESALLTRSGRELLLRWSVACTLEPSLGGPLRHVLGLDVTEVREAERRARSSERLAAVGTMAAGLAHEIRNPLNAA